jgi:Protein of unknown function (DUF1559)
MSDDLAQDDADREAIRPSRTDPVRSGRPESGRPRPADDDPYDDVPPPSGGGSAVKIVLIILAIVGILGLLVVAACGGGLYFATRGVRNAAMRVKTTNDYKQVALGLHNYHSANNSFPPVSQKTKDGRPGLSWRVAILPYVEQDYLFRQFKLDEAWDSPTNKRLAQQMPAIYAPVDAPGGNQTHMRLFVGKGAIFQPLKNLKLQEITDGTANTILFVESTTPVLWTQPDELPFDPQAALPALGMPQNDYFIVAMADGSVKPVKKSIKPEKIKAAITAQGNEMVDLDE